MDRRSYDADGGFRFRAERFFSAQGAWYCNTREGVVLGPFPDRQRAESGLSNYLRQQGIRPSDIWEKPGAAY